MPYAPCWPTRSASDGTYAASEIDVLDDFELDGSGYANHALAHDAAGNLTCDGVFLYTYDPWNHLTQVHRAYHDGSGTDGDGDGNTADPERGSLVASFTYDGLGRRVSKAVTNMADLDATYYYYYDGDRCVEVRNGSHDPIKNYVWAPMPVAGDDASVGGPGYVDELVQIIHHLDTGSSTVQTFHWVLQDVNYNDLGVVQAMGSLVERYEYAPYGDREVYIQSGVNDGRVQSRIEMSRRIPDVVTMLDEPYGLCAIGHQGLMHDEELGLIHNRARTLHPRLRRFMQRDPARYVDAMGLYEYVKSLPTSSLDPTGEFVIAVPAAVVAAVKAWIVTEAVCMVSTYLHFETEAIWGVTNNDKLKHCVLSCRLARNCSAMPAIAAGYFKEAGDEGKLWLKRFVRQEWIKRGRGGLGFDPADIVANFEGIDCAGNWTKYVPVLSWLNWIFCDSCFTCCKGRVGGQFLPFGD